MEVKPEEAVVALLLSSTSNNSGRLNLSTKVVEGSVCGKGSGGGRARGGEMGAASASLLILLT